MTARQLMTDYAGFIQKIHADNSYYSFGLICAGIEFMGRCLDSSNPFSHHNQGYPRERFRAAIEQLMPKEYKNGNDKIDLFGGVRNGLLHSLLPSRTIWLRNEYNTEHEHLSINKIYGMDRIVLVIEPLNKDFQEASNKLLAMSLPKLELDVIITQE